MTDDISLDAGAVGLGTIRFTTEVTFALDSIACWRNTATISVLPMFEHVVGVDTRTDCAGGIGAAFTAALSGSGAALFSLNVDYERVGDIDRVSGHAEFSLRF